MFTDDEMQIILMMVTRQGKFVRDILQHMPDLPLTRAMLEDQIEFDYFINDAITRWNAAKPSYRVE